MQKFILYWLTGDYEIVKGSSIASALNNAGYGSGAIRALDFYESYTTPNPTIRYTWNKDTRQWIKN